jgi:hypothetical protein
MERIQIVGIADNIIDSRNSPHRTIDTRTERRGEIADFAALTPPV